MREDEPAGPSLNIPSKGLGIRPRGIPCNRSYAVFLPLCRNGLLFRLPNLPAIAIARPTVAICRACERFTARRPAFIADADHQGGDAALSCRLCLTACNSRQFDEVEPEEQVR